jgi:PRTRC genetic system protein B
MATRLTDILTGQFKPTLGIIVYEFDSEYYIESHQIENGKMKSGVPLREATLADLVSYFHNKQRDTSTLKGIVPESVIYADWSDTKKFLVWYNKPQQRLMSFTKELHIANGLAYQPGLIYALNKSGLHIFATNVKGRPNLETKLFQAPYHNVSNNGSVCLGSAKSNKKKSNTYESVIDRQEHLFWASEFSHLAGNDSRISGNLNSYWKSAIKSKVAFDTKKLKDSGLTLKSLLNRLSK